MSLYALPTVTEEFFRGYIAGIYSGDYRVTQAFTVEEYSLPLIMVMAGQFKQYEPGTHLYEGQCVVTVATQIDDVEDPVTIHDNTVASVYDILAAKDELMGAANVSGNRFHLFNYDILSFDQSVSEGDEGRSLISAVEMQIHCQTKEV